VAVSFAVAYERLTGTDIGAESRSVKTAGDVPLSPSVTVTSSIEIDGPGEVDVNAMFSRTGVLAPFPLNVARYCTNREVCVSVVAGVESGTKDVHVASGVAVSPNLALRSSAVPLGTDAVHVALAQLVEACESSESKVEQALSAIEEDCETGKRGIVLRRISGGFKLASAPGADAAAKRLFAKPRTPPLTQAQAECLAIIAYLQPITGPEIQELRGVNPAGVVKTLLERRMVRIVGRKEVVGKPFLYGSTREFLVHFGLNSLKDLPPLEEFEETFGSGDASAVAGLADLAGLPQEIDDEQPPLRDSEEQFLREVAEMEERQDALPVEEET